MKYNPNDDQLSAIKWLLAHPECGLFLPPGFGKTAVVLRAFKFLKENNIVDTMLVVSTIRISQVVWKLECQKWDEFREFKIVNLHGPDKHLKLKSKNVDIFTINVEGIQWFEPSIQTFCKQKVFVVFDESTLFKNHTSNRFKIMKKYLHLFERRVIMSGTPTPNGLLQLWSQMFLCDQGKRLSKFITHYRSKYFYPSYNGFSYVLANGAADKIYSLVDDILMHKDVNSLNLPDISYNNIAVELDPISMQMYIDMKNTFIAEDEDNDIQIAALSAAAKGSKLKQIANGNVYYDENKNYKQVHTKKLEAIKDLVEELNGSPLIIVYEYNHDLKMLKEAFDAPVIGGGLSSSALNEILINWALDKYPVLLLHPQSGGHGLNLQEGNCHNLCWYSITFDLELYLQTNKRIHRQGVKHNVFIHHIVANNTIDSHILNVLEGKNNLQNALLEAIKK